MLVEVVLELLERNAAPNSPVVEELVGHGVTSSINTCFSYKSWWRRRSTRWFFRIQVKWEVLVEQAVVVAGGDGPTGTTGVAGTVNTGGGGGGVDSLPGAAAWWSRWFRNRYNKIQIPKLKWYLQTNNK